MFINQHYAVTIVTKDDDPKFMRLFLINANAWSWVSDQEDKELYSLRSVTVEDSEAFAAAELADLRQLEDIKQNLVNICGGLSGPIAAAVLRSFINRGDIHKGTM